MDVSGEDMLQASITDRVFAPAESPGDRDVAHVRPADWVARDLPRVTDRPRTPGFQAVFARSALNDMQLHGRSRDDIEVCGVLVGNVYRDRHGAYLHVEASIRGTHAAGRTAQVTFTAETWDHINEELERNHPGRRILGWYHTHPGFGIFLSEMDLFIQNHFVPEPWQVAYVYDPKRHEDGVFLWKQGKATRGEYLVDPDSVAVDPARDRQQNLTATAAAGTLPELSARVETLERRTKWLAGATCAVAALAVLTPLISRGTSAPAPAPSPLPEVAAPPASTSPLEDDEPYIPPSLRMPPTSGPVDGRQDG